MRILDTCAVLALSVSFLAAQHLDPDRDGDGLSDFQEIHKYFTNPDSPDSDGDGIPDGDWNERREFTYTVRSIVQVLPPVTEDFLCDDYQDARILERGEGFVELEVIHYPLNTVHQSITANPRWRSELRDMTEWLRPGITANWDEDLRKKIVTGLTGAGIDVDALDDKTLVERASKWLLDHARYTDGFTTFYSQFVGGKARVYPEVENAVRREIAKSTLTIEEQWQRELFAKGMFEHGTRGSCTSSAIYLNGCLRALGIPSRIVLAIPVVDASDEREVGWVSEHLRHPRVRRIVEEGIAPLAGKWASHTFNEVFVGGRWRRLNYDRLGQNILDETVFGLLTHVATFFDWADGNMASTWGKRHALKERNDRFGGPNPYSAIALSDRVGAHARIELDPLVADPLVFRRLTISRASWYLHDERPEGISMRLDDPETAGHVLIHVREGRPGEGAQQYRTFYENVGKCFELVAEGKPPVPVTATRGYWVKPEDGIQAFYLRIEPEDYRRIVPRVAYTLVAANGISEYQWIVEPGVSLTLPAEKAPPASTETPAELVINRVIWFDAPDSPILGMKDIGPALLLHVGPLADFSAHKRFTALTDRAFFLEAASQPPLSAHCGVGGITSRGESYVVIHLGPEALGSIAGGVDYTLRPQNSKPDHRWRLEQPLTVRR